ncbi:hypothetical protein CCACVL1_02929 [Corchorus capsularis]|uniref:Uncharacterized protein n=1 Tax=Corchorus capsularis TaxID=210143 RepID=A0A1R3K4T8_COCAP|nr:hypothetical protein CCACVL1_02929 [Corchorus capsularis]
MNAAATLVNAPLTMALEARTHQGLCSTCACGTSATSVGST